MLNKPDSLGTKASINPVSRIAPVLAVDSIGSITQELGDRATQLVKGQEYYAHVLSKVGNTAYTVKVEGKGVLKDIILKMDLGKMDLGKMDSGSAVQTGQTLLLRYIHENPTPTFLLLSAPTNDAESTADLSPAAQLIGHILKKADSEGVTSRFEATAIVTHAPNNAQAVAHDLKHAVSTSGLFYESHLSELVQGNQALAAVRQEPQNQANSTLAGLMSQQLAILENQRMSWHGEIWPGQKMDWDVYLQQKEADNSQHAYQQQSAEDRPIASEMTLHLPRLGKVTARLSIIDGRMRVGISAEQTQTIDALESQKLSLAKAIEKNGQQLDRLTITHHE
ncbi:MAG: flagellar hook-length control protein FliK [Methylotenera sp.]